jgi:lysophospholipase L1-like esterase
VPSDLDDVLPVPRRREGGGPIGSLLARISSGVASVAAQVPEYAAWWDASNERNLAALAAGDGRPWYVLGDSTAQGIGASAPDRGWVGQLAEWLRSDGARFGLDDLVIVNLSVTGAKVADLHRDQMPAYAALLDAFGTPALTTVAIGANDAMRTANAVALRSRLASVCEALPAGSVVACLPEGISMVARVVNAGLRAVADRHDLRVADVNPTGRTALRERVAADRFHPNDVGYADWAAGFRAALAEGAATPR